MSDDQKSMSRRALEMWASGNSDRPEGVFTEGYINHQEPDAASGISDKNLGVWKELISGYHTSFSDAQVRVLMQIEEGDLVASHWEFSATHTGDYLGHAPTGKRATWTGIEIDRFEGGKIAESWVTWDKYRFFEELGLVP